MAALLGPPAAAAQSEPIKEQQRPGPPATPFQQAREEAGEPPRAPTLYALPGGQLRVTPSEFLASASGNRITFEATLDQSQPEASVSVELPLAWVRTPPSGLRPSRPPRAGRGDRLTRAGRNNRLRFASGERRAAFSIENVGIPAGTYALPLTFRDSSGRVRDMGSVQVRVFPAVREAGRQPGGQWRRVPRTALNASNDSSEQSETFVAVTPSNPDRFAVGINGPAMAAYVTDDGGTAFTPARVLPSSTDVPGPGSNEIADVCCDPMFAANDEGDLWFGGLTFADVDDVPPSRIVVNRIAAGTNTLRPVTTGLRQVGPGTQDKPMMTIDNTPTSPTWGRLYVVWGEPGVRIAVTSCDTRPLPSQTVDAARCDNADNWSSITYATGAGTGSYIYADVAVAPDGKVYVTWWDYSAANAIEGAVSTNGGASFSAQQTIALLDDTDDSDPDSNPDRVPFACPILVQPGGRVGPVPGVEVDASGRVYVSWADLRPGSGSTRCEPASGGPVVATPPKASHLTWDVFVSSAAGALPGGPQPSPSAGTRVSEDGTPGETPNSDDFFPWLAIDESTGEAWIDFYSTTHDGSRQTAHFYAASAQGDGSGGHRVGLFNRVSAAASSYFSTSPGDCCQFQNDFGDYQGIDVAQGQVVPTWSDNSSGTGDGEAFVWTGALSAVGFDHVAQTSSETSGDEDGQLESGETVSIEETVRNAGTRTATNVTGQLSSPTPGVTVTQGQSDYAAAMTPGTTAASQTPFEATLTASVDCSQPITFALEISAGEGTERVGFQVPCSGPPPPPSPSPTPSTTPIATATPAPSVTPGPPRGLSAFRVGSRQRLRTVLRRGLLAKLSCRGDCVVVLTLKVDARTARRYRVPRRIARMTLRLVDGNVRSQRIRLSSRARRNLRRARSLRAVASATVAEASGGAPRMLSARVRLRR